MLVNGVIMIVTFVVCFLISELLLRIFLPIRSFVVGTGDVSTAPNAAVYGWGYAPGAEITQSDADTKETFSSKANSGGWKDTEHQLSKSNGSVRILILGDSNTFGHVPIKDVYPRVVEKLLNDAGCDVEVISMGYGGWGTDQELVALRRSGLAHDPDIVISQFDTNDLIDNVVSDPNFPKPFRFEIVNGELKMRTVQPTPVPWLKSFLLKSHIVFYANNARRALSERIRHFRKEDKRQVKAKPKDPTGPYFVWHMSQRGDPGIEAAWLLYEKLIKEMKRSSEQKGAIFLLFNATEKGNLAWEKRAGRIVEDETGHDAVVWDGKFHPIYYLRHVERLREIAGRIGVSLIPNNRIYTRFINDAHASIEGNSRMAKDIFDFLMTNKETSHLLRKSPTSQNRQGRNNVEMYRVNNPEEANRSQRG